MTPRKYTLHLIADEAAAESIRLSSLCAGATASNLLQVSDQVSPDPVQSIQVAAVEFDAETNTYTVVPENYGTHTGYATYVRAFDGTCRHVEDFVLDCYAANERHNAKIHAMAAAAVLSMKYAAPIELMR